MALSLASYEAKFARDALHDLPADAPAEVRAAAVLRSQRADQAHANAVRDHLQQQGRGLHVAF